MKGHSEKANRIANRALPVSFNDWKQPGLWMWWNFLFRHFKLSLYDFSSDSDKREDTKEVDTKDVKSKEAQEKQSK